MSLDNFVALSSALTGFTPFRLRGTGQAELYMNTVQDIVGAETMDALLTTWRAGHDAAGDEGAQERALRRDILSDPKLGPVARRILKLWYVGTWYALSSDWQEAYGGSSSDRTFVVSADSYVQGLMWDAIGANPSGARPLGYAMWAVPPAIEES